MRQWTLRVRITALCTAVGVVLGLIAVSAAIAAVSNRRQLDAVFDEIGPMRTASDALPAAVLNQETGVRGYAVNGSPADLEPYPTGKRSEAQLEAQVLNLARNRPDIINRVNEIKRQSDAWRATVADPVIARVRAGDRTGAQALIDNAARNRFDQLRAAVAGLQSAVVDLRNQAVSSLRANSTETVYLILAAALVVILAGFLFTIFLQRLVTRPVSDLAAQVRRVADGAFGLAVDSGGPPEVARLGRAVDDMRQRIVADLKEVTAARQLIEETNRTLEEQAAELTRSNRDLEQFAYVASHDLQEPLRKVSSFCQLLQRRYAGQLDERGEQYITFAVDGAQRMQRLINDLLAFSRIGRVTNGFADVDLNELVSEAVSQREAALAQTGGSITWDKLPVVRGEEPLLAALIGNLVGNSVKFRRPDVAPQVHLSAQRMGDNWEITCADNGIGIEPEFAEKVFVIFQRLHGKDAYPGTGIGLAIAKKIVEYHGGQIWLDTSAGRGTTIRFTLPVSVGHEAAAAATDSAVETDTAVEVESEIDSVTAPKETVA